MAVRVSIISTKFISDEVLEKKINDKIVFLEGKGAKKESFRTYPSGDMIVIEYKVGEASKIVKAMLSDRIEDLSGHEHIRKRLMSGGLDYWSDMIKVTLENTVKLMEEFTLPQRRVIIEQMELRNLKFVEGYNPIINQ